jgi:hypothetical protein
MPKYSIRFDLSSFKEFDKLALLIRQNYNYGNSDSWFDEFRGGLYGLYARLYGIEQHYSAVHAWLPRLRDPAETEYHLATILFQMDSALECFTFTLNALGWAVKPCASCFRDIRDWKQLKNVKPNDLLGHSTLPVRKPLLLGYAALFPKVVRIWKSRATLIERIIELHDVSKHRKTLYSGGQSRLDPPKGFFQSLGLDSSSPDRIRYHPMAEIILRDDPKQPLVQRILRTTRPKGLLEDLVPEFADLMRATGEAALADSTDNIPLTVAHFPNGLQRI